MIETKHEGGSVVATISGPHEDYLWDLLKISNRALNKELEHQIELAHAAAVEAGLLPVE